MWYLLLCLPVGLSLPFTQSLAAQYSDDLARNKMLPMAAAAYTTHPNSCVTNVFKGTLKRQLTVVCDVTKADKCSGFTAVSPKDKAIIISYRGSNGALQLLMEGDESILANHTSWVAGGSVSKFFNDAFMNLWTAGMKDDFLTLKNTHPGYELWITGHSLGGAMASLAASYIQHNKLFSGKVSLVTFGQPRTGDKDFAHAHDRDVANSFRVTHAHDVVPHIPFQNMQGYYHHLEEVYYKENMGSGAKYTVCSDMDESTFCSNGNILPDSSVNDHLHYFEKDVSAWGEAGCK